MRPPEPDEEVGVEEAEVLGTVEGMNLAATLGSSATRRGGAVGVVVVKVVRVDVMASPSLVVVICWTIVLVTGAVE